MGRRATGRTAVLYVRVQPKHFKFTVKSAKNAGQSVSEWVDHLVERMVAGESNNRKSLKGTRDTSQGK